jgi:hypothetical protein
VTGKVTMPYVIEPAVGLDRILLAFLTDAYDEETNVPTAKDKAKPGEAEGDTRVVLRLHEDLAPYKFAVLPLMKKVRKRSCFALHGDYKPAHAHALQEQLASAAKDVYDALVTKAATDYDDTATIGTATTPVSWLAARASWGLSLLLASATADLTVNRQAVPKAGRNWHALLHHHRLRYPPGQGTVPEDLLL